MAARYWVGGTGTWNNSNTTNWSATSGGAGGASAPTIADLVYFDSLSGTGTCTHDSDVAVQCAGILVNASNIVIQNNPAGNLRLPLTVNGNVTIPAANLTTTSLLTTGLILKCTSTTSGTKTITIGGTIYELVAECTSSGTTVQLGSNLQVVKRFQWDGGTNGIFNMAAYNIYVNVDTLVNEGQCRFVTTSGAGSTIFHNGAIYLVNTTNLGFSFDASHTLTSTNSVYITNVWSNSTPSFSFGGKTWGEVFFDWTAAGPTGGPAATPVIAETGNTFTTLSSATKFNTTAAGLRLPSGGITIVTRRLRIAGYSSGATKTNVFFGGTASTTLAFSGGLNYSLSGLNVTNITWSNPTTVYNSADGGGNSNVTFSSSTAKFWVATGGDTWDTTAGTKWAQTSGGVGGLAPPTATDVIFFDAGSQSQCSYNANTGITYNQIFCVAGRMNVTIINATFSASWINVNDGQWWFGSSGTTTVGIFTCVAVNGSSAIVLNQGTVTVTNPNGFGWNCSAGAVSTNQGGTIILAPSAGTYQDFNGGNGQYTALQFAGASTATTFNITGDNSFSSYWTSTRAETITVKVASGSNTKFGYAYFKSTNPINLMAYSGTATFTYDYSAIRPDYKLVATNWNVSNITGSPSNAFWTGGTITSSPGWTAGVPTPRYWVYGVGTWNTTNTTNWSYNSQIGGGGASVPTASNEVYFDAGSGTGTVTAAMSAGLYCKSINFTGFTGSINFNSSTLYCAGNFTMSSGTTITGNLLSLNFTGSGTLITAGKRFINSQLIVVGGSNVTLGDNYDAEPAAGYGSATGIVTQATCTFNTNNFSVITQAMSGLGTYNLGTSNVTIKLFYNDNGCLGGTYTGNHTITIQPGLSSVAQYTLLTPGRTATGINNLILNNPNFNANLRVQLQYDLTVNSLTIAGYSNGVYQYRIGVFGLNLHWTQNASNGKKIITANTVSLSNVDFLSITGAGTATWSGTSVGNMGNNSGITFTPAVTRYHIYASGSVWNRTDFWSATSGGATGASIPLAQDTVVLEGPNAGPGIAGYAACESLVTTTWTGLFPSMSPYGTSLLNHAKLFITGAGGLNGARVRQAHICYIPSTNCAISLDTNYQPNAIQIAPFGESTITANSDLLVSEGSTSTHFAVTSGTLNLGGYTASAGDGVFSLEQSGKITATATSYVRSGYMITINNAALSSVAFGNIFLVFRRTAGTTGQLLNNLTGTRLTIKGLTLSYVSGTANRTLQVTGGGGFTIGTLSVDGTSSVAQTILFESGVTQNIQAWNWSGVAGKLGVIGSTSAAAHTLNYTGTGVVDANYLSISSSNATPVNTWYAGANSTNGGSNTGWIFTAVPRGGSGLFFGSHF